MNKWLPSRKLVLFFGTLTLIIVGFFLISNFKNNKISYKTNNKEINSLVKYVFLNQSDKDTDGDGLKDWEENLWRTDINNKDTDGDGLSDGDEVKEGRNPLVKGPNDYIDKESFKKNFYKEDGNETANLGKELISEYLSLKDFGYINDKNKGEIIDYMVKDKLNEIEKEQEKIKNYTLDDLNIIEKNDSVSLNNYLEEIKKILEEEGKDIPNSLAIVKDSLEKKDKEILNELNKNILMSENIIKRFLEIETPSNLKNEHLELINLVSKIENEVKSMKVIFEDPIKSMLNIKNYQENTINLIKKFQEINLKAKK